MESVLVPAGPVGESFPAAPRDAWRSLPWGIPHELYGAGSTHPFGWYLEGESTVPAASLTDICAWLRGCEYRRDPELFNLPDFWQRRGRALARTTHRAITPGSS